MSDRLASKAMLKFSFPKQAGKLKHYYNNEHKIIVVD